jgi:hypothetical protein
MAMKLLRIILIAGIGLLIGCSSGDKFDPTLFNEGFTGITYTNELGEIIGPVDENDWNLYVGGPHYFYYNAVDKAADIIPDSFGSGYAYPNPTDGQTTFRFAVPVYTKFGMVIINEKRQVLKSINEEFEAGEHELTWDMRDDRGNKLLPGIYRVIYEFRGGAHLSGYGDVLVVD